MKGFSVVNEAEVDFLKSHYFFCDLADIDDIHWIIEKAREFQINFCFCFIDYADVFDCVDHQKL